MPRKKNPHSTPYIKPDYHSQNKKQTSEEKSETKKIKLRSSLDIYNRLMHDKTLNLDLNQVFIGYSDTILGDQEICILEWIMIDKGGDIPMHHILYFILKQNNNRIILWDRKIKLDRLYCSGLTNKQTQSLQYILQYQESLCNNNYKKHNTKIQKRKQSKNNKLDEIDSFIDYSKPTIAFDIDGTIVDIEERLSITSNDKNNKKMSGENYKYDKIIPVALEYLKYIKSTNQFNIIYISGRRYENIKYSIQWLFDLNTYPKGYVIHKQKRTHYLKFKQDALNKLKNKLNIIAYFGDTIIDCIASINANVRPILIIANEWIFVKHIYGGIESVINCMKDIKPSYIDCAKRSPFWGMSYIDLIPIKFATELFNNKNKKLLPPSIILKCEENPNYLYNILFETQEILEYNKQNKEEKKNMQIAETVCNIPKKIFIDNEIINKFFPRYPITNDGFVESFQINDTNQWMKYLNYYGFVVLKVLTPTQVNKTINAMFNELYERTLELQKHNNRKIYKVDINNPFTWNSFNFPSPYGKFLTDRPAFAKQAFKNRCNNKMYFIWSTIFGQKNLMCTIENWGIQRGTKDLKFIDPETNKRILNCREQIKWRRNLRPHWDINPWTYSDNIENGKWKNLYQGALALSEQRMEDGTHLNLPGCMRFLKQWCDKNKNENVNPWKHNINFKDELIKYMQPIPLRKGEMVIWNFGQLHANTKNMSDRMRLSQYMRMLPCEKEYIERDRRCVKQQLIKYKNDIDIYKIMGDMDDKTQKLHGLKQW